MKLETTNIEDKEHHLCLRKRGGQLFSFCMVLAVSLSIVGCNEKPDATDKALDASETNSKVADVDNSAKNVRDRDNQSLTPGDQSNSPEDTATTQKIRKALVGDTQYSMTAKNVKIITTNGRVTLRGPVKSDEEKSGIADIASRIAGESNVDNQLEVKANP